MAQHSRLREASAGLAYAYHRLCAAIKPPVTITPPPAAIVFEHNVPITVRDGTTLRANVFRPTGDARVPVLMCAHPYNKDLLPKPGRPLFTYRLMYQTVPSTQSAYTGWEGPDPAVWVARGYAVVNLDLRGYGSSDGTSNLLTEDEGHDYYDAIEWAARQPWCTGKIGLTGVSYLAISQWRVASQRPSALAAMCPWEGFTDFFRDFARPGGISDEGFFLIWNRSIHKKTAVNYVSARKTHPTHDAFWAALAPPIEQIDVPALVCGSFSDQSLHTGGTFKGYAGMGSAKKWLHTHRAPKWATYYAPEMVELQTRFFDHFLKERDNGFEDMPHVSIAVQDTRRTVHRTIASTAWPLPEATPLTLSLQAGGTLGDDAASAGTTASFNLRSGRLTFAWTVPRDLEIVGPMTVRLAIDAPTTHEFCLFGGVRKFSGGEEVPFEGSFGYPLDMVTKGWLRVPRVANGGVIDVEMELLPSATFFRRGDVLRLDLQGRWFWTIFPWRGQFPARYERSAGGTCTVHLGERLRSTLTVPVVG
jgi:predicted acyl esterase